MGALPMALIGTIFLSRRGSLFETQTWLDILVDSGYLPTLKVQPILAQCDEVGRLLTSLMTSIAQRRLGEERALYEADPADSDP